MNCCRAVDDLDVCPSGTEVVSLKKTFKKLLEFIWKCQRGRKM